MWLSNRRARGGIGRWWLAACLLVSFPGPVRAVEAAFTAKVGKSVGYRYLLHFPEGYNRGGKWPLLVFLHGSGERGSKISRVTENGPLHEIRRGRKVPMMVAAPQCPVDEVWDPDAVVALVDHLSGKHRVDRDRVYLTGLSMGGFGVWETGMARPEMFAALVPLCGGGGVRFLTLRRIKDVPVWCFHGAKDEAVEVGNSRRMVSYLKAAGGNVRYTEYPDAAHNCWSRTYASDEVYDWLLRQRRRAKPAK